jgi:hypothetical protein
VNTSRIQGVFFSRHRVPGLLGVVALLGVVLVAAPLPAGADGHHAAARLAQWPRPRVTYGLPLKAIDGPLTLPGGSSAFPVYRRLGAQVLEVELNWSEVAPSRPADPSDPGDPAYRWPGYIRTAIAEGARYGVQIAILVSGFPAWSNGGRGSIWAPKDPQDFASFLEAAARMYRGVHHWLILNEVNYYKNFQPLPPNSPLGPERYAELLQAAYGALKAVNSANLVIGGMNYSAGTISAPLFIRWMRLPDGAPPRMDYYGYDPYSVRYPRLDKRPYSRENYEINDIGALHDQLAGVYRRSGRVPKLWLAEFGISDNANAFFDYYVSPAVQARWVTAAYRLVDSVSYVAALGWYELLDQASPSSDPLTEGLMTASGNPKPSFYAYAAAP